MHAVFTIVQDDPVHLSLWTSHYARFYAAKHIYVLHHPTVGEAWDADWVTEIRGSRAPVGSAHAFQLVPVLREESFNHAWLRETVQAFQRFLLQSYETVLFTEIDELVVTDPVRFPGTLTEYCDELARSPGAAARCTGYEVFHDPEAEPALDWTRPVLRQRSVWYPAWRFDKTLLSTAPLTWHNGFHRVEPAAAPLHLLDPDPRLLLLHMHKADWPTAVERHRRSAAKRWSKEDAAAGTGAHNRIADEQALREWWFRKQTEHPDGRADLEPIPEHVKDLV